MGCCRGILDPAQRPVQALILAACALAAAGCRPAFKDDPAADAARAARKADRNAKDPDAPSVRFSATASDEIRVTDREGRPVLLAKVAKYEGEADPQTGLKGPLKLTKARCRLFEKGKLQITMTADEATWDGEKLTAEPKTHGVSADGKTVIDGGKAIWTADSGLIEMEQAQVQGLKNKKVDFTARGRRARLLNRRVHLAGQAQAHNEEGQRLKADTIDWNMERGDLVATGNVELSEPGTTITGARLTANTRLQKGRLSGNTRLVTTRARTGR